MMVLKLSIMASRAEDSQQTFVTVPVMRTVSQAAERAGAWASSSSPMTSAWRRRSPRGRHPGEVALRLPGGRYHPDPNGAGAEARRACGRSAAIRARWGGHRHVCHGGGPACESSPSVDYRDNRFNLYIVALSVGFGLIPLWRRHSLPG